LLTSGIDQTVDPARLAPFPIRLDALLPALAISGVLGVPGIVTAIAALGTVGTWIRNPLAAAAAVLCSLLGVLTAVIASRTVVAIASRVGAGRRAREAKTALVFIPLILLGPIIFGVSALLRDVAVALPAVADVVGWTPLGAAWAVPADIAAGRPLRALAEFGIALATLAVLVLLWRWGLGRALERPAQSSAARSVHRGAGLFARFPGTPWGAVAARALTYWLRDPRYAQTLLVVPLIPVLVVFWASVADNWSIVAWMGPAMAVLLAMSIYTDVSYDNTAFALHLQSGVAGSADRIGRVVALAVFAVPAALAITIGGVALAGAWSMLTGMLGLTIGVLLSGFAVSSVASGAFVFPVPAPGENPFKSPPGGGFQLLLSNTICWVIVAVLALPELVLAVIGFVTGDAIWGALSVVVALLLGGALLVVGIRVGGRILDRRAPELLAALQRQR
jgi:ABC-2 type transport system permease protein